MISSSHVVVAFMFIATVLAQRGGTPYNPGKKPVKPVVPVVPQNPVPDVQGNTDQLSASIQVKGTADEAMRHIDELENTVSTMKQEKVLVDQQLTSLRMSLINLQRTMQVMAVKISELDKLANQNKELTRMMTYFETFFGVLYSEVPEAFGSTLPVETRLSKMNLYLGNREAELAALRPEPRVVVQAEPAGVSDELASAMTQLGHENARLASKVANLETDVANTNAEVEVVKKAATPSSRGAGPAFVGSPAGCECPDTDDNEFRLEVIESTLDLLVKSVATSKPASGPTSNVADTSDPSSRKATDPVSTAVEMTPEDLDRWRAIMTGETRAATSTRKSIFSAIRHTHMVGGSERKVLSFDSIHVNKGSNFVNNTIFTCTIEGFYFFQFTVRSYDGHYMGVALVKNNEMMTSVYTDASERSIMQSQSLVLHMAPGDQAWLELGSSERFAIHSDVHKYVTFSGFLIFKGR